MLGLLRLELGRPPVTEGGLHFLWVVDFPLFEGLGDDGSPVPAHHPFTMPHPDDLALLDSDDPADLLRVRSQAYDLVLNGWELGSGSVRIHGPTCSRPSSVCWASAPRWRRALGFLLDAFRYGAPPHAGSPRHRPAGGPADGGGEHPRGGGLPEDPVGRHPLTNAPTPVEPAYLAELGLRTLPPRADPCRRAAEPRLPRTAEQATLDDLDHDVHLQRRSTAWPSTWRSRDLRLTGCRLAGVRLPGATLDGPEWAADVVLEDCDLSGVTLKEAKLRRVTFRRCRLSALVAAELVASDLSPGRLQGGRSLAAHGEDRARRGEPVRPHRQRLVPRSR